MGSLSANGAWLCGAVPAQNLMRWTGTLGGLVEDDKTLVVARTLHARTLRACSFSVPDRLVYRSGRPTLRIPERWPWALRFTQARADLRAVAFSRS